MRDKALDLIQRLPPGAIVLPVQTLGELFNVLVRKAKRPPARARAAVLSWRDAYPTVETSATVMVNATDLATDHGLTIWDSVVLAASAHAECRLLLSEDLQEGFTFCIGASTMMRLSPKCRSWLAARRTALRARKRSRTSRL